MWGFYRFNQHRPTQTPDGTPRSAGASSGGTSPNRRPRSLSRGQGWGCGAAAGGCLRLSEQTPDDGVQRTRLAGAHTRPLPTST
jgi:hypothetical protein